MQEINLFVFDQLSDIGVFSRYFPKITIKSVEFAFTYGNIRFYKPNMYYFYNSNSKLIFGKVFKILINEDDMELLKIFRSDCSFEEINVKTIYNVKNLYTCDYQTNQMVRASTFISNIESLRCNRHNDCGNMTKYLLV